VRTPGKSVSTWWQRISQSARKLGPYAFFFFLAKGILWLILPSLLLIESCALS
jgi:hypothetical protein